MFCKNCGKEVDPQAIACTNCGVSPYLERKFCPNCGIATQAVQIMCTKCGVALGGVTTPEVKNKTAAGLLGIFLGWLGIHKYYLGYNSEGTIMLLLSLLGGLITCGIVTGVMSMFGLIEGIIYLTKTDEEFVQIYVRNKKGWF